MDSEYQNKLEAACNELLTTGIWKSSYDPPISRILRHPIGRILRKYGLYPKPLYYNSFVGNVLLQGMPFALFYGLFMYLAAWYRDKPEFFNLTTVLLTTSFVALISSSYYAYKKRKHQLTDWKNL